MVESLENSEGFLAIEFYKHSYEVIRADSLVDLHRDGFSGVLAVISEPERAILFIDFIASILNFSENWLSWEIDVVNVKIIYKVSELFEVLNLFFKLILLRSFPVLSLVDEKCVPNVVKGVYSEQVLAVIRLTEQCSLGIELQ